MDNITRKNMVYDWLRQRGVTEAQLAEYMGVHELDVLAWRNSIKLDKAPTEEQLRNMHRFTLVKPRVFNEQMFIRLDASTEAIDKINGIQSEMKKAWIMHWVDRLSDVIKGLKD